MLDTGHGIKVEDCMDGFAVISKLDEDFVKALAGSFLESSVFFLRFYLQFCGPFCWSCGSLLILLFFLQGKFALRTI